MGTSEIERINEQGLAAWNAHDPEAFADLFADDFVWHDWSVPEPIRTREGIAAYMSVWTTAFPDFKTTTVGQIVGDDAIACELEFTGTNHGPMAMGSSEIPPTHRAVHGRGTYTARIRDGKIVEFRTHPDVAGILTQLDLLPAP